MSSDSRPGSSGPATPPDAAGDAAPDAVEAIFGSNVSRRSFLRSAGLSAAAAAATGGGAVARERQAAPAAPAGPNAPRFGPDPAPVAMQVNGQPVAPAVEPASSLLEALRNELGLTGSKQVCDRASCGGCTVLVDGEPVASCMMLAHDAEGREVRTIEGLRQSDGSLHPLQESFIRHDALQCGYCTPGFVMAAAALLEHTPKPTLDEIKAGLAGNICRCGTYTNIFNAVLEASGQSPIADRGGDR
jgi:xanthine dehydrogenase YagT iron-sulfur-binding subunit